MPTPPVDLPFLNGFHAFAPKISQEVKVCGLVCGGDHTSNECALMLSPRRPKKPLLIASSLISSHRLTFAPDRRVFFFSKDPPRVNRERRGFLQCYSGRKPTSGCLPTHVAQRCYGVSPHLRLSKGHFQDTIPIPPLTMVCMCGSLHHEPPHVLDLDQPVKTRPVQQVLFDDTTGRVHGGRLELSRT